MITIFSTSSCEQLALKLDYKILSKTTGLNQCLESTLFPPMYLANKPK